MCEDGEVLTVMKSKGIMKKQLQVSFFENKTSAEVEWTGLKKINKRHTKAEKEAELPFFSIKEQKYKRTFYKNTWGGMELKNGIFYPFQ